MGVAVKRHHVSLKTKLAAALCQMMHDVDGRLELIFTHEEAKQLSEDQILSLFNWDHDPIPHAEGGEDAHYNIVPKLIVPHRIKTRMQDVPRIAKNKRISREHEEFRQRILAPRDERPVKQSRWPKRSFSSRKAKK